jgi:superfamily II DNA or RNA helicase
VFRISKTRIYLPRYYGLTEYGDAKKNSIPPGTHIDLNFVGTLREVQQKTIDETFKIFDSVGSGLISLDTGLGKTVVALKLISLVKLKTLVVVHAEFLLEQWVERIKQYLPTARIGVMRQDKCVWEDVDIVVGMIQSIVKRDYPKDAFRSFGFMCIDECFPYRQLIITDEGMMRIGTIYNKWKNNEELPLVLSFNESAGITEFKRITHAWEKINEDLLKISYSKSNIKCTENHKILTPQGYVSANILKVGDLIQCNYNDNLQESMVARTLNDDQYQIFIGSYLGDGHVHILPSERYRLSVIHGEKQRDYCGWKAKMMNTHIKKIENNGYAKGIAYVFCTRIIDLPIEKNLNNTNNKKHCPQWVLDDLDYKGLAIWWMDDGSLSKTHMCGTLSTCCFDEESHIRIVKKLQSMGINCKYRFDGHGYFSTYFLKEGITSLLEKIRFYLHDNLKYKFYNKYTIYPDLQLENPNIKYNWNTELLNYGTVKISSITKIKNKTMGNKVYDIEVEDNHNFICGSPSGIGPIVHNCHHISSRTFSSIFFKVQTKYMVGLSATPERKDGLSKVIYWFLGPQIVNFKRETNKPKIKVVINDSASDYEEKINKIGKVNIPIMITDLTTKDKRNELIIEQVLMSLGESRKILILTERRNHAELLVRLLLLHNVSAGLYLGGMKQLTREDSVTKSVIIGTYQASGEGFDVPDLDTLILSTPKSDVEQAVGRILRKVNKNEPVVIDIVDMFSIFKGQYYKRRRFYKKCEYEFI